MPDEQVVSGATETAVAEQQADESSSADTQTEEEQEQQAARERTDYRKLHREDPDLNAYVQQQIDRAIRRRERATLREAARYATEATDPAEKQRAALEVAQAVATEMDEDEEHDAGWIAEATSVQPHIARIVRPDASGQATNPWYVRLHQRVGKSEMDRRYAESPVGFLDWVEEQIDQAKLDARLKKVAPALARGIATDEVNQRLQRMPQPLSGGAGSGSGLTLEAYEGMTADARAKLRKENPRAIDDMVARYSR